MTVAAESVEDASCFGEAICVKDHARASKTLAAWSGCPRRLRASKRNFPARPLKFLFEALSPVCGDVTKRRTPLGVLAWSFAQSRVFDPPYISDVAVSRHGGYNRSPGRFTQGVALG